MNITTSWTEAEETVFQALALATGAIPQQTAFKGDLPPVVNAWALYSGGIGGNEQALWTTNLSVMHFQARLLGRFAELQLAQEFVMKVIAATPITSGGNVACFRIRVGGLGEPRPVEVQLNERVTGTVFEVEIGCELVFTTNGKTSIDG